MGGFLIILILFVAVWLLFVLPARRRRSQHSAMQDSIDVGDDVITAGGLHGTIRGLDDSVVGLAIAPSVLVKLDRRAIAAVATEIEVEAEVAEESALETETDPGTPAEPR